MFLCLCNICLLTRSRLSLAFTDAGKSWWLHWEEINERARTECEKARAEGYVDPPAPPAPGVLLN
jgi:hypothetical protein